jgi:hypothetical protein
MSHLDPILAEIRAIRDARARQFNYDVQAMMADMKAREVASGLTFIKRPPKRCRPPHALATSDKATP